MMDRRLQKVLELGFYLGKFASVFQVETCAQVRGILQLFPTDDVSCYYIQASGRSQPWTAS